MNRGEINLYKWLIEPLIKTAFNVRRRSLLEAGLQMDDAGKPTVLIIPAK